MNINIGDQVIATSRCYDNQVGIVLEKELDKDGITELFLVDFYDKEVWLVGAILRSK